MRNFKPLTALALSASILSGGAILSATPASATTTTNSPSSTAHVDEDSYYELLSAECIYDKNQKACARITQINNPKVSKNALRCMVTAGIAIGGLVAGDGIPDVIALAVARKYVAVGTAACVASLVSKGLK